MMDDDKMDEMIRRAAADYNRPPATPRDEMWEAIRARRAAAVPAAAPRVIAFPVRRTAWMAAAAVALLAAGIGIGRRLPGDRTAPAVAVQPAASPAAASTPDVSQAVPGAGEPGTALASAASGVASPRSSGTGAPETSGVRPLPGNAPAPAPASAPSDGRAPRLDAYQFATAQHLVRAEALLTAYRAGARRGTVDAELSTWARDLLGSTRLLLDSPAATDARRRRVLEDLELVLVQLVQLGPDSPDEERELLDRTLERGDVMTRLRTTVPADAWSTGSE